MHACKWIQFFSLDLVRTHKSRSRLNSELKMYYCYINHTKWMIVMNAQSDPGVFQPKLQRILLPAVVLVTDRIVIFTARNEVEARLYFHRRVWFCSQGGLPQCMLGHPPGADTPPDQAPPSPKQTPPAQSMLGDTVNARAVRILLECNLVVNVLALSI